VGRERGVAEKMGKVGMRLKNEGGHRARRLCPGRDLVEHSEASRGEAVGEVREHGGRGEQWEARRAGDVLQGY